MGEERSKESDGGSDQSDGRRKRSGSFFTPLTQTEGVVVQRAPSHNAAVELKTKHTLNNYNALQSCGVLFVLSV